MSEASKHMLAGRKSLALLVVLLACRLISARDASAITAGDRATTAAVSTTVCATPIPQSTFRTSEERAYLWLALLDASVADTVDWQWFAPDDSRYASTHYDVAQAGDGCAWAWIDIQGQAAASKLGAWRVDVYLNGAFAFSNGFTIASEPPPPALTGGAAHLELTVSDHTLVPWAFTRLGYRITSYRPDLRVDLYLGMLLDGDGAQCVSPELFFTNPLPPFASDVVLTDTEGEVTAGYLPAVVNRLDLTVYGVLVEHGKAPGERSHWLSNLAAVDLAMGPLSSAQLEVLAARGNPRSYVIEFFHEGARRIETWMYDGGGTKQVFQFINGRALRDDDGRARRARASVASPPVVYGPGRFVPTMSEADVRALLGDPGRVLTKPGGVSVWVFRTSRVTLTWQNGLLRLVEVY